jgi:hypothetical protein
MFAAADHAEASALAVSLAPDLEPVLRQMASGTLPTAKHVGRFITTAELRTTIQVVRDPDSSDVGAVIGNAVRPDVAPLYVALTAPEAIDLAERLMAAVNVHDEIAIGELNGAVNADIARHAELMQETIRANRGMLRESPAQRQAALNEARAAGYAKGFKNGKKQAAKIQDAGATRPNRSGI